MRSRASSTISLARSLLEHLQTVPHKSISSLQNAIAQLNKKDQMLIEYVYGICPQCLKCKERKSIRQASLLLGLTEDGAQKKLKSILNKLKKYLQE